MHIPARILRKHALDVDRTLRDLTLKEEAREERILKTATHLIAHFGLAAITFTNLAVAIKVAPSTMRKHFTDLDALVGEIMRRQLQTISQAIGAVPRGAPDRARLQRAAYIDATRVLGAPTVEQLILTTYRTTVAEDERVAIDDVRAQIGFTLCPENPEGALHLLDCPCFDAGQIEAMLTAAGGRHAEAPAPQPRATLPAPVPPVPSIAPDLSNISGMPIQGGRLGSGEPCQPLPWEAPERLCADAELRRGRAPPTAAAA